MRSEKVESGEAKECVVRRVQEEEGFDSIYNLCTSCTPQDTVSS